MISVSTDPAHGPDALPVDQGPRRICARGYEPAILADIYEEETNIAIWERRLSAGLRQCVEGVLASTRGLETALTVTPQDALARVSKALGTATESELSTDIAELVDMFCCLLGLERAGMRLAVLDHAMCPRFHVDRVPCRLITTYRGVATEWLPHQVVDRSKLGRGSTGSSDLESGLFQHENDVQQLVCGDVALLKGELWEGNAGAGLVHRSPSVSAGERRLLLTLDVSD